MFSHDARVGVKCIEARMPGQPLLLGVLRGRCCAECLVGNHAAARVTPVEVAAAGVQQVTLP